jgi:hypothetical protein
MMDALKNSGGKITMLADGFVDEVWEIISSRADLNRYTLYTQMVKFAERITSSGTGGVGLELLRKRRAFGGFTANIGYAAARLGVDTAMVGVYGKESLDPIFEEVAKLCDVYSIDDPATTHVFEFDDGKILMSHMEAVLDISWKRIVDAVGLDNIRTLLTESNIIGIGYWSLVPAFDDIFDNVCANLPDDGKERRFFFDFADFRKKDEASLNTSMLKIKGMNAKFPMTLSVNEHEAATFFVAHGETFDDVGQPIQDKAEAIRKKLGLDEFVIHAPQYAVATSSKENPVFEPAVFCEKPKRTAGAGDSFNGAYIAATLAGLNTAERLKAANAAVGYFIRNAAFPEVKDLF